MHLHAPQVLAAISGLLALSSANPLSFDAALGKLDKRGCQADCGLPNRPLARQLGQPCGGQCDQTYRLGSETCSCDLGAIILCKDFQWQLVADCAGTGQRCFNNQPGTATNGRTCNPT